MSLEKLSELRGVWVAHGDSDIRGWPLYAENGRKVGIIEDLTVDTDACKVREAIANIHAVDRVVPIGLITLDERAQHARVALSESAVDQLPTIPYWHSRERQVVRETYFPNLVGTPLMGELEVEDLLYRTEEPRISRMEEGIAQRRES